MKISEIEKNMLSVDCLTVLEELRDKLINLESFIEENKNIEKRIEVNNIEDLQDYYNNAKDYIIEELGSSFYKAISRIVSGNKIEMETNATLIMDSSPREQHALIDMFNADLSKGVFEGTFFQNGIFLPSFKSTYKPNPKNYLFLDPINGRPNVSVMDIKFLYNKYALSKSRSVGKMSRADLEAHILKYDTMLKEDYSLIKEYFMETAYFVVNNIILAFKDEYIKAKRENLPVIISTPLVNTEDDDDIIFVLETLYNKLFEQEFFKDTILKNVTTSITKGNTKYFNPTIMSPFLEDAPKKQYNLRIMLNTHDIENNNGSYICYNNHR